ncbi:beta-ketoacyl-[acyl-carrier-protein] synthase II [Roseibium algicola]|jgi:3-oxoacyl-[acyl-carrier-protein] synthase II|uniref:3-oxoacyl-[acyl-carrier-protein] synthase 2 n=1 Tax=Roseibium algicola TaxID=2857014 RepID=A0ABM6HXN3_9HYPH|nr:MULTISPECIES: beta-ketoacyl-ACP synthase II [Stappiaceae]AMN54309.1 3-oxoacyl-ACP synthase [Labrenzia sp. CP4]AQQ02802.1 beta-ketoacyl-[acyl-carrier-protein] synthase II [Roseibium aggregatum]ERP95817.1 3-oxoacyl-ACP synthase [Labrenzia sp. C1B10]ERS05883.1 3-oxoacyl-ACP synthase [Labrenzia sp. C1B70]MBO6856593.1 beta-ketoacyl-ACP synthase II [Roseibium sp.]
MRRVVVTGLGIVSPLGTGVDAFWNRVKDGSNGIRQITHFDAGELACQIAGEVPSKAEDEHGFDVDAVMDPREQRRSDRFIHFAMGAVQEALAHAGWEPKSDRDKERTGTIIATGVGGFPAMTAGTRLVDEKGPRRASPFLVPSFLANLAAGQVSIRHGLKGPIGAPVTACAASLQALGDAARIIRSGEADVMVAGGSEACIDKVSYAGFCAAKAMSSKRNGDPAHASRPFDQDRDGFIMGEGAGILILEDHDHATARGATILAELAGYGTSADAYHVTASSPDGEGGLRAMRQALSTANLSPGEIGYVNAHSTSTPVGDAAEIAALTTLFENRGKDLAVSSSKSMFGHLLGAAGAVEAIACVKALMSGLLPPSRNLEAADEAMSRFEMIPGKAIARDVNHILTNGFGFGGVNASAVFSKV